MPRPCVICSNSTKLVKAAELIAAGQSDQGVADALNALDPKAAPMSYMAVSRHRRNHIVRPMQDRLTLVAKGEEHRQERQQLAAAVASGAPTPQEFADAVLGLRAQAEKLQRIEARLERMAELAEQNGSPGGAAIVAGQQLRGVEVGAKLAGVGGYAPQKGSGPGIPSTFTLVINLPGAEPTTITAPAVPTDELPEDVPAEAEET
jgi:hypothetical protein